MHCHPAGFFNKARKAQLKIQQMAFVLVAIFIFFSLVALIFFAIYISSSAQNAVKLQNQEALEIIRKLSSTPEFIFTSSSDCSSCIDLDKLIALKTNHKEQYKKFWNLDYLMIERVYPSLPNKVECTLANYPDCNQILLIDSSSDFGEAQSAFVSLAHWDSDLGNYKYEIGRIYASGLTYNEQN